MVQADGRSKENRGQDLAARFWGKVEIRGPSECWLWIAGKNKQGYGSIRIVEQKRAVLVHRLAFELTRTPLAAGQCVLHRCDVPACVNPAHLFVGTRADNNKDMWAKGRWGWQKNPDKAAAGRGYKPGDVRLTGDDHWSRKRPELLKFGEKNKAAKLTVEQVRAIRAEYAAGGTTQYVLAAKHGVTQPLIKEIIKRRIWKDVE